MNTIPSTLLRTLIAGAILSALSSIFTVSSANEAQTPPQVVVKFADLDISTQRGAVVLYRRISSAADDVCWRMYRSNEAYKLNKNACLQKVIADAVTKVNEPALFAVFSFKYRVSAPEVLAAAGVR
jgi:UrcA family protein